MNKGNPGVKLFTKQMSYVLFDKTQVLILGIYSFDLINDIQLQPYHPAQERIENALTLFPTGSIYSLPHC